MGLGIASHEETDYADCAREPIHIPGSIQPHGGLLVLAESDFTMVQASENLGALLGRSTQSLLNQPFPFDLIRGPISETFRLRLEAMAARKRATPLGPVEVGPAGRKQLFHTVAHSTEAGVVLELEVAPPGDAHTPADAYTIIDDFTQHLESETSFAELCRLTADEVQRLTGFDRVLIYRFDSDWAGTVVGESGNGQLPALMDHRFPASDIPAQARELYRLNRVRVIPNVNYQPVPILPARNPRTSQPLDLTYSILRSVSPVHLEYVRNMETASSLSVSVIRDGQLLGLIACHNRKPRSVSLPIRSTCDLVARAFSLRLSTLEHSADYQRRFQVQEIYARLLATVAQRGEFAPALIENPRDLLAFAAAGGAAVLTEGNCQLVGDTPPEEAVRDLAHWLASEVTDEVYHTDSLPQSYPAAQAFAATASGLLAVSVSKLYPSFVMWFRPEVIRTVKWGGDPTKPLDRSGDRLRLHPRRSFATWRETVRDRSRPWHPSEIDTASELRNAIVGTVLRKAEEFAALNAELQRSNKELEAFSYSVSHDLRAPLRHIVGYAEILRSTGGGRLSAKDERCLATIIESSEYAGHLVDKLLGFSKLGRAELQRVPVDMNLLVGEVRRELSRELAGRTVTWQISKLPIVMADLLTLRLAVRNLLENALKYSKHRAEAVVSVSVTETKTEHIFAVADNGVGFDMAYVDKLFGVFQRLHRMEDYEGTGIGLANVRRIIERHGGRTWAEGKEDHGATFYFTLPKSLVSVSSSEGQPC